MVEQVSDPFLRVNQVLRESGQTKSPFYLARKRWDDEGAHEPEGFPPPDGYLNNGNTPVWLLSTVNRWKAALLAESRLRAAERSRQHKTRPASPASTVLGAPR